MFEVECRGQIPADRAMPGTDGRNLYVKALLQKLPDGGVIKYLRIDPSALAPRRNDQHRDSRSQSPGTHRAAHGIGGVQVFALRIGEILPGEIERRAPGDRSVDV